jgi:polysaccharide deacetylase family protein (PEP-CTERM system associated)
MRTTFFVVGEIAEEFPDVLRTIEKEGHEIGCHTHTHQPLSNHTKESFRDDLRRNVEALQNCVSSRIQGFRAPVLSLTQKARWAYEVLAEQGFTYSSSVLPANNPLHGWPGFGEKPVMMDGVLELPVTLANCGPLRVPIGAGTYFRCLPFRTIRKEFEAIAGRNIPVIGYFHPYDCDAKQQWVMNQGVKGNPLLNALLYVNRSKTIPRLRRLVEQDGFEILPYSEYLGREFPRIASATHVE